MLLKVFLIIFLIQILGFVNFWVQNVNLEFIGQQLDINSKATLTKWSRFCREVLLNALTLSKEKLGGIGKIVEIDESKFGKRKYHRGRIVEGSWVFGAFERDTGRVFMITVDDRFKNSNYNIN